MNTHHDHTHPHETEVESEMSFSEKMKKRLTHWIRHSESHVASYREWAEKAKQRGLESTAGRIEAAAEAETAAINAFSRALQTLEDDD